MQSRLAITGGVLVTEHGAVPGNLTVDESGRISAVLAEAVIPDAAEVVDATGLLVLPGVVDGHSHLNDPGYTDSEDFYTGTCGAAAGGVTTVIEHPLTDPLPDSLDVFLAKREIAGAKAVVDYALWAALTPDNVSYQGVKTRELARLAGAGAVAFKGFMTFTWEIPRLDDGLLMVAFRRVGELGLPIGVHSENGEVIRYLSEHLRASGREDPLSHGEARPEITEREAVARVLELSRGSEARVHLVHLSVPEAVDLVARARFEGRTVSAETCPHYLTLTEEALTRLGPYAKCNPPLRSSRCVEGMWQRLSLGRIDSVGSDHGPFTRQEKERDSFWDVPAGVTGIQVMLPLMVTECLRRGIPLESVVRLCSSNPARLFGLYPRKGVLAPGSDADLVLLDPREQWELTSGELFAKEKWTPHEGWRLTARVRRTIVRGQTVYVDGPGGGRICVEPGYGRFLRPGAGREEGSA
ncbi:MAG: allantoinase AllB [bacterium]|nr:allantoinase AllB [bacterium]